MANVGPLIPALLLVLFLLAVLAGTSMVLLALRWRRKQLAANESLSRRFDEIPASLFVPGLLKRPSAWLAVRSRNVHSVQLALGLHNVQPCTWSEGLSGEEKLFVAPPVKGWVLIIGSGLPDPAEDVDACYRFVTNLSKKLGQVQFFVANRVLGHHAWVRADSGRITRGYAWAGRTIWNQGKDTRTEAEFGLKCYEYFEPPDQTYGFSDVITGNVEKVSQLAAHWSIDPATVDETNLEHVYGIAGEPPRLY
jgi:hypothetical protein